MNNELNLRVFRRNKKNTILIWNSESLTKEQIENVDAEIEVNGLFIRIKFSKFVPHNVNKFTRKVEGVVIGHDENKLDPARFYNIKIVLGIENKITKMISILPFKTSSDHETRASYLHAFDRKKGGWDKLTGEFDDEGNFRLLVKS